MFHDAGNPSLTCQLSAPIRKRPTVAWNTRVWHIAASLSGTTWQSACCIGSGPALLEPADTHRVCGRRREEPARWAERHPEWTGYHAEQPHAVVQPISARLPRFTSRAGNGYDIRLNRTAHRSIGIGSSEDGCSTMPAAADAQGGRSRRPHLYKSKPRPRPRHGPRRGQ